MYSKPSINKIVRMKRLSAPTIKGEANCEDSKRMYVGEVTAHSNICHLLASRFNAGEAILTFCAKPMKTILKTANKGGLIFLRRTSQR